MATPHVTSEQMAGTPPELLDIASLIPSQPEGFSLSPDVVSFLPDYESSEVTDQPFRYVHGKVRVPGARDSVPYTATVPRTLIRPVPHILLPGFGGKKATSTGLRNILASDHGTMCITFDPARLTGLYDSVFRAQKVHVDTADAIMEDIVDNPMLQDIPNADEINWQHLVVDEHSMGGVAGPRFALKHSGLVVAMNKISTVGVEQAKKMRFAKRIKATITEDIGPAVRSGELDNGKSRLGLLLGELRYYGINVPRTIGEMGSCMAADELDRIKQLREAGVKIAFILGLRDKLLPYHTTLERGAQHADVIRIIDIGHAGPQSKVQGPLVAKTVTETTDTMIYSRPNLRSVR